MPSMLSQEPSSLLWYESDFSILHPSTDHLKSFLLNLFAFFRPITVPGVWHSAAVREQALHYKSRGIYFCHPEHLPGHHLPVQLPAADHGRRPWIKAPLFPKHKPVCQLHYLNSHQTRQWLTLWNQITAGPRVFFSSFFDESLSCAKKLTLTIFWLYIWTCDPGYTIHSYYILKQTTPAWSYTVVVQQTLEIPVSVLLWGQSAVSPPPHGVFKQPLTHQENRVQ